MSIQIGEKIKELRIRNGLTQEELADRAELSKGFISQLERDLTSPSISTLEDILQVQRQLVFWILPDLDILVAILDRTLQHICCFPLRIEKLLYPPHPLDTNIDIYHLKMQVQHLGFYYQL